MIPRSCLVVVAAATLGFTTATSEDKVATGVTYGFFDGGGGGNRRDDSTTSAATSSSTTITTVVEETMITSRVAASSEPSSSNCIGFGCSEEPSNSHDEAQSQSSSLQNLAGSCTPVELELTTDGRPQDISFELVCNDYTVWTYPSALIPYEGPHGELVVNACVFLHNKCCHFALHDSHGDGLEEGDSAYVALKVSDETVLHYDSMTNPPFTTLAHSFGDTCSSSNSAAAASSASSSSHHHSSTASSTSIVNVTPKDIPQDVECEMGLSRPLNFRITLDEHPEDLSWFLVCSTDSDGDDHEMVTVWDQPRGSLAGHVGQVAAEKACIPYRSTCTFSIIDSQGDGLTSMDGNDGGGYTLTLGVSLIDAFVNEPFSEKSYCIGRKCNPTTDNLEEQKEEFQKELEQLEQEQQEEQEMLEKLKESSETTQEEIDQLEKLEQSLEEQEELEQQQQPKHKPPASDDQVVVPSTTQEEEDLILLTEQEQEALTSLEEEEESFQSWLIAGLGILGFLLVLVVCTGYYMHRRIKSRRRDSGSSMSASLREAREALTMGRRSSSAKEVMSEMVVKQANAANRGHGDLTTITDSEDTEDESTDDDGMFVLDA